MRKSRWLSAVAGVAVLACLGGKALAQDPANEVEGATRAEVSTDAPAATALRRGKLGLTLSDGTLDPAFAALPGAYVMSVSRDGGAHLAGMQAGDIIMSIDGKPTPTSQSVIERLSGLMSGQVVSLQVVRGEQGRTVPVTLMDLEDPRPLLNAERPGSRLLGSWGEPTRDPIRTGDVLQGVLEKSDSGVGAMATDDYLLDAVPGKALAVVLEPHGTKLTLRVYQCADGAPEYAGVSSADEGQARLGLWFTPGPSCATVIRVEGVQGGDPYRIFVREQTPTEFTAYQAQMQQYYAEQERQRQQQAYEDSQPSMFGAIVRGLAMGVSGIEGPLMNADGSEPNTLDVLNAANAELQRQNAEGQARLEASIRYAQRQAEMQQAEQARAQAQAEADARAAAQAQAQAQAAQATAVASSQADAATQQREAQALAEAAAAEAKATAEAQARAEAQAQAEATARAEAEAAAEKRRQEEQARLAERQRKEEEARRPVAFAEGVTLCKLNRGTEWRCDGPLQVSYGNIETSLAAVQDACGSNGGARDLGVVGGYRAFGCGFGIHPTDRDYPGNRDVPAQYGLYIPSRATFHCPKSTNAYCRS